MAKTHNLGFPRIGAQRELKFALENHWKQHTTALGLQQVAAGIREQNWQLQRHLDQVPVGDFSLYDQVLDMSQTLGNLPARAIALGGTDTDQLFRAARGRAPVDTGERVVAAAEMTKWFDTNYHYLVPEFSASHQFQLNSERLLGEFSQARQAGYNARPVILGPVSYLRLGRAHDDSDPLALLPRLVPVYQQLLEQLSNAGADWVQIDEPILTTDLTPEWQDAFTTAYTALGESTAQLLLTTYFGALADNLDLVCSLPVAGLHVDAVRGRDDVERVLQQWPGDRVLSLGVINGRNIWKTDLDAALEWLLPIHEQRGDRLWLAPSCSLLHVPVTLAPEDSLPSELHRWLAFAVEKLEELNMLAAALNLGREAVFHSLDRHQADVASRAQSSSVHNPAVQAQVEAITPAMSRRNKPFSQRAPQQQQRWQLPQYPTTTIGSFPQTPAIREARRRYRQGEADSLMYEASMKREIEHAIRQQEALGIDVLVHGEPERNDMVEYFGEQLEGFAFTRFGWVQSYGSRCVKPPIIFGDVSRPAAMTVGWSRYAQSLTRRPVKGMLTGPVTILNWSFVRDDQPRADTCRQIALAIRDEVRDLEAAGIGIIQIDEPALREGLPLRRHHWNAYLDWAVESFRLATSAVSDGTQIHTHMCYSQFNDIMESIIALDADVITIEASRSGMKLLEVFEALEYPNQIGPGIYDIHSPNIPAVEAMETLMQRAAELIPAERLWINPDCGLKTRTWEEVSPALANMVAVASRLRESQKLRHVSS